MLFLDPNFTHKLLTGRSIWGRGADTVHRGASGDDVAHIQEMLNAHGAYPPLRQDGVFGKRTEAALEEFQRMNGMTPDGVVTPETMVALNAPPLPPLPPLPDHVCFDERWADDAEVDWAEECFPLHTLNVKYRG